MPRIPSPKAPRQHDAAFDAGRTASEDSSPQRARRCRCPSCPLDLSFSPQAALGEHVFQRVHTVSENNTVDTYVDESFHGFGVVDGKICTFLPAR